MTDASGRRFLFLQGPHGPFFRRVARQLMAQGAQVHRAAFSRGDEAEWRRAGPLHRFNDGCEAFPAWLGAVLDANAITDVVLYDDVRPVHCIAAERARARGLTLHCLHEGHLPGAITYERWGSRGASRLMEISLPRIAESLGSGEPPGHETPATQGDDRQRLWHEALYHARCLLPTRRYYRSERLDRRALPLWREGAWSAARALEIPFTVARHALRQWQLIRSDRTFHLVLLQRSLDPSMRAHSDVCSNAEFIELVIDAFAEGAAPGDHLVFRAHPFDDGRERLGRVIRGLARDLGVGRRVMFVGGGRKLEALLDRARSVITVNSTATQQALCRGLPVATLGQTVYARPALVSQQPLAAFIRQPQRPDMRAYWLFRQFLMETSQVSGSFYARRGIERLAERLPGMMLDPVDPYDRVLARQVGPAAARGHERPRRSANG